MGDTAEDGGLRVRAMTAEDAGRVVEMIAALSAHEGAPPPPIDREALVGWSLGEQPRFSALVAETGGAVIGYALFHDGFHIGRGSPGTLLMDLFVEPAHRRRRVARALIAAVARATAERGGDWITWQAHPRNVEALAFYEAVGARRYAAADYELADTALDALLESGR